MKQLYWVLESKVKLVKKVIFFHFDFPDGKQFQNTKFSPMELLIVDRTTYFTEKKKKKQKIFW